MTESSGISLNILSIRLAPRRWVYGSMSPVMVSTEIGRDRRQMPPSTLPQTLVLR